MRSRGWFFGVAPSPVRGRNRDVYWATTKFEAHSCREAMTCVRGCIWSVTDPNKTPSDCAKGVVERAVVAETKVDGH